MAHRDHEDQSEREQAQDRPDGRPEGEAPGEPGESLREAYGSHIGRGFPHRTNVGLRAWRRRLTRRARGGRCHPTVDPNFA
ncbi:hypothetical protein GCM10011579_021860 [Streptomyces albiflavescens]|uniref:Uncharacterized protein n=1 Tax=Streptomyces albiflavescens TaxID=1623582 RepID=A0A917XXN4_9ACTN|nr:hypothetical protein GCM10011579_021860 [Streptomyces albiflavescens]